MRVLVVEAVEADAAAIVASLRDAGHDIEALRVDTPEALAAALGRPWDLITCEWDARGFAGRDVVQVLQARELDTPFIVVSQHATEDNVVDAMRMGAHDFIHKDRLGRLPIAVARSRPTLVDRDVSARAHAAAISEARFQSLWSSDFMLIGVTGTSSRIVDANPGFVRVLGYTRDELRQLTWEELTTPESNITDKAVRERLFATGRSLPWEKEVFAKDGRRVPLLASVVILPGPRQAIVMAIDLTERNRLTDALIERVRIAEATTEVAVEATASDLDAFLQRSAEAILRTFGGAACRLWTLDPATEAMNLRANAGLVRPGMETTVKHLEVGDRPANWPTETMRPVDREWATEHALTGFAVCRLEVGGVLLGVLSLFSTRPFSETQQQGLRTLADAISLGVLRANAEATKSSLEAQLRQAQKLEAIGSLAGGIAHDFNNMLSVIIGYADFLREGLPPEHELVPDVAEITTAATRAQKLTAQLLAFSRGQVLQPRVLDLDQVIADLLPMLRRLLTEDIELVTERGPELVHINADANQIEQVLMNLVVNARDAIPGSGSVTIVTERVVLDEAFVATHIGTITGPHAKLSVRDTGSGMTPDVRARLFEPFFTTKPLGKGTGLGLSTVFGIVKQSGGALWVESAPGEGATFEIYFPLATAAVVATPTPARDRGMFRGGETILLCEDEPQVRTICREILVRAGYRVLEAVTGEEAIGLAAAHRKIDLLVTDVVMPQMSGRQLAENLTAAHPAMRVLYISGYTDDAIVRTGVSQEGVAFLQKPLHPDELVAKVRDVLDT